MVKEIYLEIAKENPDKIISSVEIVGEKVIITVLVDNEYYELCNIDVNTCKINVNNFLILYDDFIVNKSKITSIIKQKKKTSK